MSRTSWPRNAHTRAASSPAGPPPTTTTGSGASVSERTSGSVVSWPERGSTMHDTRGFRLSRTWQTWLHSTQGRTWSGTPSRSLDTRSVSAIWARVISTASATPSATAHWAWPASTTDPCSTTGTRPSVRPDTAARTARQTSTLKPGAVWPSGRVAPTEKIEPRTTVSRSTWAPSTEHRSAASSGACSGVIPAHGASSSHDSRSATTASGPTAARTAVSTWRAKSVRSWPHSSSRWLVSPDRNWRTSEYWPALTSTPSQPARTASAADRANPSTTAAMSAASIHFGTSRVLTSGTRDGARSGSWFQCEVLWPPAWPRAARTSAPSAWQASATAAQPSAHSAARGARS